MAITFFYILVYTKNFLLRIAAFQLNLLSLLNQIQQMKQDMATTKKNEIREKLLLRRSRKAGSSNADIEQALIDFTTERKGKSIKDLRGKISFREGYDYKTLRSRL